MNSDLYHYSSFEVQVIKVDSEKPLLIALVYRPPKSIDFISQFSAFLTTIMPNFDQALILGDLNIHVCCPQKPMVSDFINLIESFNLSLLNTGPTHRLGHTLDLVLSYGLNTNNMKTIAPCLSDHCTILFDAVMPLPLAKPKIPVRLSRYCNSLTATKFSEALSSSPNIHIIENSSPLTSTEELISLFNSTCATILDTVAPLKIKKPKPKGSPWLNDTTRALRRDCRRSERRWKHDRLQISFDMLKHNLLKYQEAINAACTTYFSNLISNNSHNPRILFKTINSVIHPAPSTNMDSSVSKCSEFLTFFINKVNNIRQSIPPATRDLLAPSICNSTLDSFLPITLPTLNKIISNMKPATCQLDIAPSPLLKEVATTAGPSILAIINSSLTTGTVPNCFKHAIVQPLLKKTNSDPSLLNNYRPISKLPFMSKILEKVILSQLMPYLDQNNIMETFQSGFKTHHSTESALLKVHNDLLMSADTGNCAILLLLDLSAAFDTVDHPILLDRLQSSAGVQNTALDWFTSYLKNRSFSVSIGSSASPPATLSCGVPQGSILGPILFSLYMLPLGQIIRQHNISFHCYADDTQLYLPLKPNDHSTLANLNNCLADIRCWMAHNFLQLNDSKFELVLFGPPDSITHIHNNLGNLSTAVKPHAKNLGVLFDSAFKFDKQVNTIVKTSFFHLRSIAKIKSFLSAHNLEIVIHALISSRLAYCNSLYTGITQATMSRLQLVQNAAARLLTGTRKRDHITPILASLHWLPVRFRIQFKTLLFVYKALNGLAPPYISQLISYRPNTRNLRSADKGLLETPTSIKRSRGDRAFAVAGPTLWNSIPLAVRSAPSLECFKSRLKTLLYAQAFECS